MEGVVLNPKYYSSIFECLLITDKGKEEKPVHFLPGPKGFDIISKEWDNTLYHIRIDQIGSVGVNQNVISISCNNKISIKLRCDKFEKVVEALQVDDNTKNNYDLAITQILPQLNLESSVIIELNQALMKFVSKVITTIDSSVSISKELVYLLACVYQLRFPKGDWKKNIQYFKKEFYLFFLLLMVNSLEKLSQQKADKEYLSRIVSNTGNTISLLSDPLRINVKQLLGYCAYYCEEGGPTTCILSESKKVKATILEMFRNERRDDIVKQYFGFIDKMYLLALIGFCGKLVDIYDADIVHLTNVAIDNLTSFNLEKQFSIEDMNYSMKLFVGNMLKCCNEKRYESLFQFVFAAWAMVVDDSSS